MTHSRLGDDLASVGFTTPTPFSQDASAIAQDHLRDNLAALDAAGASLYVPCGNTGEYYSLSRAERIEAVRTTVETVPESATVLAGAGGSTAEVLDLLTSYANVGADAGMIMHPGHTYRHQKGLGEYYRTIAEAAALPIVVYKRSHAVPDDLLVDLAELESVVGVKYAVNDVGSFARTVDRVPDTAVTWLNGIAERFAPAFALEGADGFTTGIGNFAPDPVLELHEAIQDRDWERARELRARCHPLEDLREETGEGNTLPAANNVPVVKFGMERAGYYGGPVREPLVELSERDRETAASAIDDLLEYPDT